MGNLRNRNCHWRRISSEFPYISLDNHHSTIALYSHDQTTHDILTLSVGVHFFDTALNLSQKEGQNLQLCPSRPFICDKINTYFWYEPLKKTYETTNSTSYGPFQHYYERILSYLQRVYEQILANLIIHRFIQGVLIFNNPMKMIMIIRNMSELRKLPVKNMILILVHIFVLLRESKNFTSLSKQT
jgi:hypothetical protein